MITNSSLTIYHMNGLDTSTHLEKWTRYNYSNVWFFSGRNANINNGYSEGNNVEIRIPYNQNTNLDISNFEMGDIIVQGTLDIDIESRNDLSEYLIYEITSIKNNNFGNNQHIHVGGK